MGLIRRRRIGIIPAYAGSTTTSSPRECMSSDHPRIRGEHAIYGEAVHYCPGSSPHTRGALRAAVGAVPVEGIIPAYAGSTELLTAKKLNDTDHPRIRGEHADELHVPVLERGSSPHTRGARRKPIRGCLRVRIIPAYAGSTRRRRPPASWFWDHPRIRGEHPRRSPPRHRCQGIIPAYAGSTCA